MSEPKWITEARQQAKMNAQEFFEDLLMVDRDWYIEEAFKILSKLRSEAK